MKVAKKLYLTIAAFLVIALSMLSITYAWIRSADNTIHAAVSGKVVQERFHTGDGTQSNPYVITKPIHYYHMVEFFQRETSISVTINGNTVTSNFGSDFIYFQLGYDFDGNGAYKVYAYNDQGDIILDGNENPTYSTELNMAYYSESNSLMPIGTSYIPFYGVFDGKGLTIKNLNIISSEDIPNPANLSETITRKTADIGIFGYVKQASGVNGKRTVIKDTYFENVTISLVDVDASITCAGHISDDHETAYVGYLAGHVTIDETILDNNEKKVFVNTYINNCTITGGNAAKSNYGLFGRVDNSQGVEMETLEETISSHIGDDPGANWGGSITFNELNMRIYEIINGSNVTMATFKNGNKTADRCLKYTSNDEMALSIYRGGTRSSANTYLAKNPETNNTIYNMVGSGAHSLQVSSTKYTSESVPGTYLPLSVNGDNSTASYNTGYIVGSNFAYGSSGHTSTSTDGTIRSASSANMQISASLGTTSYTGAQYNSNSTYLTYDSSKFELLTNSSTTYSNSNYYRISDSYNKNNSTVNSAISGYTKKAYDTDLDLKRYEDARSSLDAILSGSKRVHGLHFMGGGVSSSSTASIPSAIINGSTYTNYPVLLNSIDFNLKEEGYITVFAGSFYYSLATSTAKSFFSLYKVTRGSNNAITGASEIKSIWKNNTTGDYVYVTNNESTAGCTKLFDLQFLTKEPPVKNAVYYFEIPVGEGEFAIGSSASDGGYLLYLDIGSNGNDDVPQSVDTVGNAVSEIFDVDFRTSPDVLDNYNLFQFAVDAPNGSLDKFDVTVYFDKSAKTTDGDYDNGLYIITINNSTGSAINLTVYLRDNDNNSENQFPYAYKIIANGNVVMNSIVDYWKVCKIHSIPSS
ncbi:MAG: hypothetical protein J6T34_03465 [Bacilli bacterium]|nr:hypothetical protein [Bacilli bacterium]